MTNFTKSNKPKLVEYYKEVEKLDKEIEHKADVGTAAGLGAGFGILLTLSKALDIQGNGLLFGVGLALTLGSLGVMVYQNSQIKRLEQEKQKLALEYEQSFKK